MDIEKGGIVIGKLLSIGGLLQKSGNKLLMPFGLTQQQSAIFFEIAKAGKVKQKDMVNRLSLEKAHVSKVVKKLETMGLLTISPTEEDKRSYWLIPTTKGEEVHKACKEVFENWNMQWMKKVDEEELDSIIEKLALLQNTFREITEEKK